MEMLQDRQVARPTLDLGGNIENDIRQTGKWVGELVMNAIGKRNTPKSLVYQREVSICFNSFNSSSSATGRGSYLVTHACHFFK